MSDTQHDSPRLGAETFREYFTRRYGPYPGSPGQLISEAMQNVAEALADWVDALTARADAVRGAPEDAT